jgi:hypothetical protein
MGTNQPQIYNLNLSPKYVPTWGAWEVIREVICNAMDADTEGMKIDIHNRDEVTVSTTTEPSLASMLLMGEGDKAGDASTIGQFGEGLKLAALAARRAGEMIIETSTHTVYFSFLDAMPEAEAVPGLESLHAVMRRNDQPGEPGLKIKISMDEVGTFGDRFLSDRRAGPIAKATFHEPNKIKIYCKGVYVTTIEGDSIWDWNLRDGAINRDRSLVSDWDIKSAIAAWVYQHATTEQVHPILVNDLGYEAQAIGTFKYDATARKIASAFKKHYGEEAVMAMMSDSDQLAKQKGMAVVPIRNVELRRLLEQGGIQTTDVARSTRDDLSEIEDYEPYAAAIAELQVLNALICAPRNVYIRIFQVHDDGLHGRADCRDHAVWLSEALMGSDDRHQRVRTYLHEMAHIMSSASDGSVLFEHAQDGIAGRLGVVVLDEMSTQRKKIAQDITDAQNRADGEAAQ